MSVAPRFRLVPLLLALAIACPSFPAHAQPAPKLPEAAPAGAAPAATYPPPPVGDLPPAPTPPPLSESLSGDAKREYETALLLYKSGDFRGAETRFRSAFDISKDIRLLWNAAACAQGSRQYARAIALVRRYLDSRSALITPDAERNARAFLEAALPLTAKLVLVSNEPGASVYLDDEHLGAMPLDPNTRVDFGTHRLLVMKPDFVNRRETFTVTSPADIELAIQLERVVHQGRLVVRAGKNDSISLDGRFLGLGSIDAVVPSGPRALRVSASGSRTYESRVLIEDDRTRAVDVALEPAPVTSGLPTWAWVAGGAVLAAGATTAAYFIFRSPQEPGDTMPSGTAGKVELPFR